MLSWLEFCINIKKGKILQNDIPGWWFGGLTAKHIDHFDRIPLWMTIDDFIILRKHYKRKLCGYKGEMIRHRMRVLLNHIVRLDYAEYNRELATHKYRLLEDKLNRLRKTGR